MSKRFFELLSKEQEGKLTDQEAAELYSWINLSEKNKAWYNFWRENADRQDEIYQRALETEADSEERSWRQISGAPAEPGRVIRHRFSSGFTKLVAAVIVTIAITSGFWYYYSKSGNVQVKNIVRAERDLLPGGNKATLTLASGRTINLDNAATGSIMQQGAVSVVKQDSNLIAYDKIDKARDLEVSWHTINIPRGGQYRIILPDGSKVWLNSASSLRFPTFFAGNTRQVMLIGQAYFEVANNKDKPFRVEVNQMQVQVLGTHFDIDAYADEVTAKTTLLEGSVKILNGSTSKIIVPGQQAQLLKNGLIKVNTVDTQAATAWVNDRFDFDDLDISSVMRQLSRWYDVDVEIQHPEQITTTFSGRIRRSNNVSKVFSMLESSGHVQFKIENEGGEKKIIVLPK